MGDHGKFSSCTTRFKMTIHVIFDYYLGFSTTDVSSFRNGKSIQLRIDKFTICAGLNHERYIILMKSIPYYVWIDICVSCVSKLNAFGHPTCILKTPTKAEVYAYTLPFCFVEIDTNDTHCCSLFQFNTTMYYHIEQ